LASILPTLLSPPSGGADNAAGDASGDDEDGNSDASGEEGDTHSRALMHLFEVSLDLLSLNAEQHQATRGLRDAVKKAWQAVCALYGASLSVDVLDSIVAAVIGEEQRADEDGAGEGSEGSDQEASDDEDEMDESPEKGPKSDKKGQKGGKGASKGANKASVSEQDASDDEDVMISDEAAFDMLTEGVDEDSDLEGVLQHSGEADSALAQLIALKQQSRKAGVLQAHKQALLVRSRSIDILEVRVNFLKRVS
jgi:hypothetical protein